MSAISELEKVANTLTKLAPAITAVGSIAVLVANLVKDIKASGKDVPISGETLNALAKFNREFAAEEIAALTADPAITDQP